MSEVDDAGWWSARYQAGDDGWDKGRTPPPLVRLAREGFLPPGARVLVPGAGRGHDAFALQRLGFRVTAADFAGPAVAAMRQTAADLGPPEARGWFPLEILGQDLFTLPASRNGAFDAVLEHTCLCAIDPGRRAEYAAVIAALLRPGGHYYGLLYAHGRPGGPPFGIDEAEARALFEPGFAVARLARAADSIPERAGAELEFVFVRRA